MIDCDKLEELTHIKEIFSEELNNPKMIKQKFSAQAIIEAAKTASRVTKKILSDSRLEEYHSFFLDTKRRIIFEKNFTRFALYILVLDFKSLLYHLLQAMLAHRKISLKFELFFEHYLYAMNDFLPWAIKHFGLNTNEVLFYKKKIDAIGYLFMKSYDDQFLAGFQGEIDSEITGGLPSVIAIEMQIFAIIEEGIEVENIDDLIAKLNEYLAKLQLSDQEGSAKISAVFARFIQSIESCRDMILTNSASGVLISDFLQKCALYTADHNFAQSSLAHYFLVLQIESALFKIYLHKKGT